MGTRSLTIMKDNGSEIAVMYRQYDGYPSGHGKELAEFLSGFEIVNGFGNTNGKIANGGFCLAAQIIAHFKNGVGGFYLRKAGARKLWEEYRYYVDAIPGKPVQLKISEVGTDDKDKVIFRGTPEEFLLTLEREAIEE